MEPGIYHLRAEMADGTRIQHFGLSVACGQLAWWVVEEEAVTEARGHGSPLT